MIPIRDHTPSGIIPYVTYSIIGINILVFVYMLFMGQGQDNFINRYALIPSQIAQGEGLLTFITSIFMHGGVVHILGNMLFLKVFGDNLEAAMGRIKYILFYLLCGVVASSAHIISNWNSDIPTVGASGAIAGLMGAYLVLFPHAKIDVLWSFGFLFHRATVPAKAMLIYWIVFQLFYGFGTLGFEGGGVAYFAHIGGFLFGVLLVKLFVRNRPRILNIRY